MINNRFGRLRRSNKRTSLSAPNNPRNVSLRIEIFHMLDIVGHLKTAKEIRINLAIRKLRI